MYRVKTMYGTYRIPKKYLKQISGYQYELTYGKLSMGDVLRIMKVKEKDVKLILKTFREDTE